MTVAKKVKASVRARVKLPNWQTAGQGRASAASTFSHGLDIVSASGEANSCQRVHCTACAANQGCLPNIASCCIEAFARQGKHSYRLLSVVVMTFLVVDAQRLRFPASRRLEAGQVGRRRRRRGNLGLQFNCYFQRFNRFN